MSVHSDLLATSKARSRCVANINKKGREFRVHSDRLGARKAHSGFGANIKKSIGGNIPSSATLFRAIFGSGPLPFAAPRTMEEAFGYRGTLRFVGFGYCGRKFSHCDGGDDIPSNEALWLRFLHHPLVAPHLPKSRYSTLHGGFDRKGQQSPGELKRIGIDEERERLEPVHWLLLDRLKRRLYTCRRDAAILFFALTEPVDQDWHMVFVDGLLVSAGNEDYKEPPSPEVREQLFARLDEQFEFMRSRPRRQSTLDENQAVGRNQPQNRSQNQSQNPIRQARHPQLPPRIPS